MKPSNIQKPVYFLLFSVILSCQKKEKEPDAYGNFESVETVVSAQSDGSLIKFNAEEGQVIKVGQEVALVDTVQLAFKRLQLQYSKRSLRQKLPDIQPELDVLRQQIATQEKECNRMENLFSAGAATAKQLDDIRANIRLLHKQLAARRAELITQAGSTLSEQGPLNAEIRRLDDQINKSHIINPASGTVLVKYAEKGEIVRYGTPLYKIGALDTIILRAYISGGDLGRATIGKQVRIRIDMNKGEYTLYTGRIVWLSSQAEFTPKIIQTRDERVNMVYAVKVKVPNDGAIKIGMPGELFLNAETTAN